MRWSYDPGTTCVYGEDKLLARVTNFVDARNKQRIGQLLAAAPDLLAALKAIAPDGWLDDDTMDHMPGVKAARAAIAKAEGRL